MSALRISRRGYETVLIDQGPANPYPWGKRRPGGQLVTGQKAAPLPIPATTGERRAQMAQYVARRTAEAEGLCGRKMEKRSGTCARAKGHTDTCRTRDWMDRKAVKVRKHGPAFTLYPERRR